MHPILAIVMGAAIGLAVRRIAGGNRGKKSSAREPRADGGDDRNRARGGRGREPSGVREDDHGTGEPVDGSSDQPAVRVQDGGGSVSGKPRDDRGGEPERTGGTNPAEGEALNGAAQTATGPPAEDEERALSEAPEEVT